MVKNFFEVRDLVALETNAFGLQQLFLCLAPAREPADASPAFHHAVARNCWGTVLVQRVADSAARARATKEARDFAVSGRPAARNSFRRVPNALRETRLNHLCVQ